MQQSYKRQRNRQSESSSQRGSKTPKSMQPQNRSNLQSVASSKASQKDAMSEISVHESSMISFETATTRKRDIKANNKLEGSGKWSQAEIEKYEQAFEKYGRNWVKIANCIGTRTRQQVCSFFYYKQGKEKRKPQYEQWTDKEEKLFIEAVSQFGRNWPKITEFIETRDYDQVSSYAGHLSKRFKDDPNSVPVQLHKLMKEIQANTKVKWATEEEEKLLKGYKQFGRNWSKVANFVGSRDRMQVGNYVYKLNILFKDNPDLVKVELHEIVKESQSKFNAKWPDEKHSQFLKLIKKYKKRWRTEKVWEKMSPALTKDQFNSHFWGYYRRACKDPSRADSKLLINNYYTAEKDEAQQVVLAMKAYHKKQNQL